MTPLSAVGIVLAGGRSTRMGTDKALLTINGETLLARVVSVISGVVTQVVIVGRTDLPHELAGATAIADAFPGTGPLGGIATGLARTQAERALVVATDQPFLQVELLRFLLGLAPGYDAVVPVIGGVDEAHPEAPKGKAPAGSHPREAPSKEIGYRSQPTCAVYGVSSLPVMRRQLADGHFRLRDTLSHLQVRWVNDREIKSRDPERRSFLNVNSIEDWERVTREGDR